MNINQVSTATHVGSIDFNLGNSKRLLDVKYNKNADIHNNGGRVYLIVSNGEIKKIGGSQSKGGIKSTLAFYMSANQGRPSIRSYGIMSLIANELKQGKNVEIYMIQSQQVTAPVLGLFDSHSMFVSAFKEMESKCIHNHKQITGGYPAWNFQKRGESWPEKIQKEHAEILSK